MCAYAKPYPIEQVVDLLGLDTYGHSRSTNRFNVDCPFCGRKKLLNINIEKASFRCPACTQHGGALKLWLLCKLGENYTQSAADKAKQELREALRSDSNHFYTAKQEKRNHECKIANDQRLHAVYSALLGLEPFALVKKDYDELKGRGLSDEAILRNQYRSFRTLQWVRKAELLKQFEEEKWDQIQAGIYKASNWNRLTLAAGIYIGDELFRKGLDLQGCPGFFKFGQHWCFRISFGMYIPVRNSEGEIVGLVVHDRQREAKYMILSTAGFPYGTPGSTRVHFPLGEDKNTTTLLLTEGILKGDVVEDLLHQTDYLNKPVRILSVHGVDSISEVEKILSSFNVDELIEAYDMDKLTKTGVQAGAKKLRRIVQQSTSTKYSMLLWGEQDIPLVLQSIAAEFASRKCELPECTASNPYKRISSLAGILNDMDSKTKPNERRKQWQDWPSTSKGLDDYLFNKIR